MRITVHPFPAQLHATEFDATKTTSSLVALHRSGSERNGFFTGKLLSQNDLQSEQQYQRSELLLSFEHGSLRVPFVIGKTWSGTDRPPESESHSSEQRSYKLVGAFADFRQIRIKA